MNTLFSRLALCLGVLMLLPIGPLSASPSSKFTLISDHVETLIPAALTAAQKRSFGMRVSAGHKSVTLTPKSAALVAVTGPDTDMLSYRLGGLRNPVLIVPRGTTFTLLFANTDDDMFHNIRFGPAQARFPNDMAIALKSSVGTPPLAHRSETEIHAARLVLRVPTVPGIYAYFCTVRGHAQGGMTGEVIVQ